MPTLALLLVALAATLALRQLGGSAGAAAAASAVSEPVDVHARSLLLDVSSGARGVVGDLDWIVVEKRGDVDYVKLRISLGDVDVLRSVFRSLLVSPQLVFLGEGGWRSVSLYSGEAGVNDVLVDVYGNLSAALGPQVDRLWSTLDRIVVTNSRYQSETVITSFDREKLKKGLVIHVWPLPYTCYNVDLRYADDSTIEDNVATFMQPGDYVVINMTGDGLVVVVNATIGKDHVVLDMSARARVQMLELGEAAMSLDRPEAVVVLDGGSFVDGAAVLGARVYYEAREGLLVDRVPLAARVEVLEAG
ncbi:hypothetical protein [Pyrodictium abyssi]|uniref:Uncharacterized protein n=1 Tax=Pyrodictium abyssi TaxID=54256 RepID=A0ABM8ITN0_9CREN|nr:hypothetical protein PABY_04750 [Pyrodictium abyssi]